MSTRFSSENYANLIILVVTTFINGYLIRNTSIDLGATITVMKKETLPHIVSFDFHLTPTVLELVDISKVKPEGVDEP